MAKFVSAFGDDETVSNDLYLARLRYWRNNELANTDWTQISDSPVDKEEWALYRQALRELPESSPNPKMIELPNKPDYKKEQL
jgi:hypothetical protein